MADRSYRLGESTKWGANNGCHRSRCLIRNHVPRPQTFLQLEKAQRSLSVGLSLRRKLQSVKKKVENWKQVRLRTQKFASLQLPNKKPFWEVFSPFTKKRAAKEQQTIRVTSTIGRGVKYRFKRWRIGNKIYRCRSIVKFETSHVPISESWGRCTIDTKSLSDWSR